MSQDGNNGIAVYVAQKGKCAVSGVELKIAEMHCHHIKLRQYGGTDEYENLIFITDTVHKLIHAQNKEVIEEYQSTLKLSKNKIDKLKELRELAKTA